MKNSVFRSKAVLIGALALILMAGTAYAAMNLMRIRAEANDSNAFRGGAVFTECIFANASHINTVESTITGFVRWPDGSELVVFPPETGVFAPGDARMLRGAVVVEEDMALGTGVWVCRSESTTVGGPRPSGQVSVDSDAASFDVFDVAEDI